MSKQDVAAQEGDLVQFVWSQSEKHYRNRIKCMGYVHHIPCATGDAWIIETETKFTSTEPEIVYIQQYDTMTIIKRKEGA